MHDIPILLTFAAVMTAIVALMISLLLLTSLRDRSESRYNREQQRADLSEMRASYEHNIANLTMQLMATEQRWRDVNHLVLSGQSAQMGHNKNLRIEFTPFLKDLGISAEDVYIDPKLIFVLTPFDSEESETYRLIEAVCKRNDFRCVRGDEQYVSGDLLSHIVRLLVQARLVIANIGTRNPNVFYELGIAQALGKQTILVARTLDNVPFDLQSQQIVIFHENAQLNTRLAESLLRAIQA